MTSAIAERMRLNAVDVISDDEETGGFESHATKETLTRAHYLEDDVFGLRDYTCNAPPVEPFFPESELEAHRRLCEVFCPTRNWRIDGGTERRSAHHEVIVDDIKKYGKSSLYAQARCPYSGVTAVHACAINGYLGLLRAMIEFGDSDPTDVAEHLGPLFDARVEKARGADALWMAKRRGHKACVDYLLSLTAVRDLIGVVHVAKDDVQARSILDKEQEAARVKNVRGLGRRVEDRRDRERIRSRELHEGCRVRVLASGAKATVRYVGPVDYTRGTFVGIELDHDGGRNSGVVKGREYFECPPKRGLMVPPSELQLDDVDYATMTPVDRLPRNKLPALNYFHEKYDSEADKRRLSRLSVRKSSFSGVSLAERMIAKDAAASLGASGAVDEAQAQAQAQAQARFRHH